MRPSVEAVQKILLLMLPIVGEFEVPSSLAGRKKNPTYIFPYSQIRIDVFSGVMRSRGCVVAGRTGCIISTILSSGVMIVVGWVGSRSLGQTGVGPCCWVVVVVVMIV